MKRVILFLAIGLLLAVGTSGTEAQSGGSYALTWFTVDGGGGSSSGGNYALAGTMGQPDAGSLSGGSYALSGGFWPAAAGNYKVYLPLIRK